jgi:hypothetical protein
MITAAKATQISKPMGLWMLMFHPRPKLRGVKSGSWLKNFFWPN